MPHKAVSAADRDATLLARLRGVIADQRPGKVAAKRLMANAARGKFHAGWQEEAEDIITKAYSAPAVATSERGDAS